jgi:vacuolar-type H+-ATPase subunit I/STV1
MTKELYIFLAETTRQSPRVYVFLDDGNVMNHVRSGINRIPITNCENDAIRMIQYIVDVYAVPKYSQQKA